MLAFGKYLVFVVCVFFIICCSKSTNFEEGKSVALDLIPYPDVSQSEGRLSDINSISISDYDFWEDHRSWMETFPIEILYLKESFNTSILIDTSLSEYSYSLEISNKNIAIKGNSKGDLRNAFVTIMQLAHQHEGRLPIVTIRDKAEFDYRGMHLDVGRHMFPVDKIKQYIDFLCYYKYNRFHWHLTEDQGWRIEIPAYPKLQEIAAYRKETLLGHYNDYPHQYDGERYGGYYTQREIREVVGYASARGIEIIPEIEMPGHAQAAIAAYPELGCTGILIDVATKWGVFDNVFCPNPETFQFLKTVIDNVVDLFPSSYIHIGGDECPKGQWKTSPLCQRIIKNKGLEDEYELQSYFIGVIADYVQSKGRTIIGWDEILEGGLHPSAIVMSWRGSEGAVEATKEGHRAIMTPGSHCYFDHYQSTHSEEPIAIGGLTTLEDVYNFSPIPTELNTEQRKLIWGVQGNVWTEYMSDFDQVSYMALSRMMALSEVQWNTREQRTGYGDFVRRFLKHHRYWTSQGVKVADHTLDVDLSVRSSQVGCYVVAHSPNEDATIFISHNDQKKHEVKDTSYLAESGLYIVYAEANGKQGRPSTISFEKHKGTGAQIQLENQPSVSYSGSGNDALLNGVQAPAAKYGGPEWLGFEGTDMVANLAFAELTEINQVSIQFYRGEGQWIYLPKSVELLTSEDGIEYMPLAGINSIDSSEKLKVVDIVTSMNTKFLKIRAKNHGVISQGRQGAGHGSWLFVGEIKIE